MPRVKSTPLKRTRSVPVTPLNEIPTANRKLTPDRIELVWETGLEAAFDAACIRWHIFAKGNPSAHGGVGQNQWIANEFRDLTGVERTHRQVASHLQQRRRWFALHYGTLLGISWDEYIVAPYVAGMEWEDAGTDYDFFDTANATPTFNFFDMQHEPSETSLAPRCETALPQPAPLLHQPEDVNVQMDALVGNFEACAVEQEPWTLVPSTTPLDYPPCIPTLSPSDESLYTWSASFYPAHDASNAYAPFAPSVAEPAFYPSSSVATDLNAAEHAQSQWVYVDNSTGMIYAYDDEPPL